MVCSEELWCEDGAECVEGDGGGDEGNGISPNFLGILLETSEETLEGIARAVLELDLHRQTEQCTHTVVEAASSDKLRPGDLSVAVGIGARKGGIHVGPPMRPCGADIRGGRHGGRLAALVDALGTRGGLAIFGTRGGLNACGGHREAR